MSLLNNLDAVEQEEVLEQETNVELENQEETVLEGTSKTEGETEEWLQEYKTKFGDEWSDKHENLIKKFTRDGQLDTVELLKAHRNLEKSFSEKRQAPETYEINYAEEVAEYKIDEGDELYNEFLGKAKEMNLLNDQVNGILNLLAGHVKKSTESLQQEEQLRQEEIKKQTDELKQNIPNFDKRAREIKNFLLTKLEKDEFEAFAGSITSENHMKAVEKLMKMNRDPVVPTPNNNYSNNNTGEDQISILRQKIAEAARKGDRATERSLDNQLSQIYEKLYK